MSEDNKPKNTIADILARKKQMQHNHNSKFSGSTNWKGKINTKGFGGPAVTRKAGRGS